VRYRIVPLFLALLACDSRKLLDVTDVEVASPESLQGVAALDVIYAGAVGDFGTAYAGNVGDADQVQMVALFTDEYISAETFLTRTEVDRRGISEDNATMTEAMREIQKGRAASDFASDRFLILGFPNDVRRAETMNLAGLAIVIMAENYCSGVPLSRLLPSGAVEFGAPRTTAQLWDDAIAKFDSSLALTGTSAATAQAAQRNLASVGRGRALLNAGRVQEAASAVASVGTNFTYRIAYSANTTRENNAVWVFQRTSNRYAVADREGLNGLPYRSEGDSRAPALTPSVGAVGFDGSTPMFYQNKFPLRDSAIPVATGTEARLIEAEAALQRGDLITFGAKISEVRAFHGLSAAAIPSNAAAQVDLLFRERAYTMWLTAHRLGDLRRLVRQYGRAQSAVFPSGAYHKGGTYGTDVNWIIPLDERNNPLFKGCLDRNA
jgi:hypothetical protein